jgi:hydroxyacid-oxoacid transhydrogenase
MPTDTAFQVSAANIRFGSGVTAEVGMDLADMGAKRTMLVVDPALVDLSPGRRVVRSLADHGVDFEVFDGVVVEPTDRSFRLAAEVAVEGGFDSFVAVGGGSTIDTAKVANLYSTHPADFFDYVNAPIGKGRPVPAPLKPLIAIPTTTGSSSETTGVAIFDLEESRVKTGIAHRYLKPSLGIVDPENASTEPSAVAASTGLDVLSSALESYTALPFDRRPRPAHPAERPPYQGANPINDVWALEALRLVDRFLVRAVRDPDDIEARGRMMLAAVIAGFGNAGVHLPHGMSYPVAGMVRSYRPPGYHVDHPMVPHGFSVIVNAPAVVRMTAAADPVRHLRVAEALGADTAGAREEDAGGILHRRIVEIMREVDGPNGLESLGYNEDDIPSLVEGALPQRRVMDLAPIEAGREELTELFRRSLTIW